MENPPANIYLASRVRIAKRNLAEVMKSNGKNNFEYQHFSQKNPKKFRRNAGSAYSKAS